MFNLTPFPGKKVSMRHGDDQPIYTLQREMNKVFEDFFRTPTWDSFESFSNLELSPRVDVTEAEHELVVKVELPGMTEKDVEVSINRDQLSISGEKKEEKEHSEKGWYRMERQFGTFSRTIPLPCDVDKDKAEATFKHGVLSIKMPKTTGQRNVGKVIPVKSV